MRKNKSGQALLIIMLAMATIATVVMSIVSRSISQVEVTNREEESLRAFSAAEAGIEEALINATVGTLNDTLRVTTPGGTADIGEYEAEISGFPNTTTEYNYPFEMLSGDSATVWMVTRENNPTLSCAAPNVCYTDQTVDICWGEREDGTYMPVNDPEAPALVLDFIYESGGDYYVATVPYDPWAARPGNNNFLTASNTNCDVGDKKFSFSQSVSLSSFPSNLALNIQGNVKMLKVKMLYNENSAQTFAIKSGILGSQIPSQGRKVTSTGQSGSATRKIEAYLIAPTKPGIFDNVVYSPNSIIK